MLPSGWIWMFSLGNLPTTPGLFTELALVSCCSKPLDISVFITRWSSRQHSARMKLCLAPWPGTQTAPLPLIHFPYPLWTPAAHLPLTCPHTSLIAPCIPGTPIYHCLPYRSYTLPCTSFIHCPPLHSLHCPRCWGNPWDTLPGELGFSIPRTD